MSVEKYIYFLNIAKPILIFFYIMTILYKKKEFYDWDTKKINVALGWVLVVIVAVNQA